MISELLTKAKKNSGDIAAVLFFFGGTGFVGTALILGTTSKGSLSVVFGIAYMVAWIIVEAWIIRQEENGFCQHVALAAVFLVVQIVTRMHNTIGWLEWLPCAVFATTMLIGLAWRLLSRCFE